ncbi:MULTISPECIES: low specificity L-threonine aldolase [unclassified Tessaracoccus]|uniref:threonine aldolase family protein n=1 Tax=unclassified Tessaracoccus TaxID=2635419 RepID=UPI00096F0AD4|nr:GntG family PLP-dependent aldolase [Tessaracoccus sp. ZS01]MBB1508880.1 low specificity L-threonine aldolase [Tessaracoccus sp. MC1756]MCG6566153.1 low specificity L-threonine aldolase [Tessaracoccus sp. ZS01]OMG58646.1 low specificity L-threonine aldolase [Tessaracoccus sp. ZS01]
MIDLRSDTVTRPSAGMLAAMVEAPVGDDVYGEDPTVAELERRVAGIFGKEDALFCATGSLANQLGIWLHTPPGTEVLCDAQAHIARAEMGAHGAVGGVTMRTWGSDRGRLVADDALAMVAVDCGPYLVETACIEVEDSHNFGGGTVQDFDELGMVSEGARALGIATHLDGARLANAAAVTGRSFAEYGSLFDTVSICLSKGLGAPVGSVLVGSAEQMARARVQRKRLGAGWRQAGVLAAAGLYALDHNLARVVEDHTAARVLAETIDAARPGVVTVESVVTNIVLISTPDAPGVAARLKDKGVLVSVLGPRALRAVTHLDVTGEQCAEAGQRVAWALR